LEEANSLLARFALVPVVVALVLASGCGGSSDTSSASDWANNFCSALATWSSSVRSTANSLKANQSKDSLKSAVDKASGVQGVVTAASSVSATLSKMGTQINSALSKLDSADPGGELKQAFGDSSACKNLTSSGP